MPLGYRTITGLTPQQATDGLPINSIPGDTGGPVSVVVLFALGSGLPASNGSISIILYPDGSSFSNGTDSNGNISATITLTNSGDDIHFSSSFGTIVLTDGFWGQSIRSAVNSLFGERAFNVQFLTSVVADFTNPLIDTPTDLAASDVSWDADEEKGSVELSFSYDNSNAENPVGLAILRDGEFVGTIPWVNGTTAYTYTDYVFTSGDYTYTIAAYKYPSSISPASPSVAVSFSGTSPDINVTTDLAFGLDWVSTVVLIADPSGIYTLVPGKTHDTLYTHGSPDTVDVKIPDPFIRSGFLG